MCKSNGDQQLLVKRKTLKHPHAIMVHQVLLARHTSIAPHGIAHHQVCVLVVERLVLSRHKELASLDLCLGHGIAIVDEHNGMEVDIGTAVFDIVSLQCNGEDDIRSSFSGHVLQGSAKRGRFDLYTCAQGKPIVLLHVSRDAKVENVAQGADGLGRRGDLDGGRIGEGLKHGHKRKMCSCQGS